MLTAILSIAAFAVDVGYVCLLRVQSQRAADSAALAASQELLGDERLQQHLMQALADARTVAVQYAAYHAVGSQSVDLDPLSDVTIGTLTNASDPTQALDLSDPATYNAVQVRVSRSQSHGGQSPSFFARFLGVGGFDTETAATVCFGNGVVGFRPQGVNTTTSLLPLAMDVSSWHDLMTSGGSDQWKCDSSQSLVTAGADGICEAVLTPLTAAGGNAGTFLVGSDDDVQHLLTHQIRDGVRKKDLTELNGQLQLDPSLHTLDLAGQAGIDQDLECSLQEIVGHPRTIALFETVSGSGAGVSYTIVGFAGVRILDVDLDTAAPSIVIQPTYVRDRTALTATWATESYFVHQPPHLVR